MGAAARLCGLLPWKLANPESDLSDITQPLMCEVERPANEQIKLIGWIRAVVCPHTAGSCSSPGHVIGAGAFAAGQGATVLAAALVALRRWQWRDGPKSR